MDNQGMDPEPPRVSIGVPVYNGERYLSTALDSILAQTFTDFEVIISDNASSDRTEEICQAYRAQDPRISYYRQPQNRGAAWNQSYVVELARGEYFKWAHHDDLCQPEFLSRCVEILDQFPTAAVCYPKTLVIDQHGQPLEIYEDQFHLTSSLPEERFRQYLSLVRYGHGCNPLHGLMRTAILRQTPLIESYPSSDLVLLGELVLRGEFYEVPEPLFLKRDHPHNSVRAYQTYRERVIYLNPSQKGKLQLTHWQWLFSYLRAIRRSPMSNLARAKCYLQMLRWLRWKWILLSKDLLKAVAWPILSLHLKRQGNTQLRTEQV